MFCQECNKPKKICQDTTPTPCECPVRDLSTDCVVYTADESTCSGIPSGVTLTEYLQQLDTFICNALEELNTGINLINVGTGLGLYKGIDVLGRREIKSLITTSDILTLTANTEDVTFGIDKNVLNTFVEENQKTYSVSNVGTDPLRVSVYKDSTIVGDNTQFNFRTIVTEDLGMGESFLRDIQQNTDELNVRVKTLVSDNLTITATDEEVRIETPSTASIPGLYVNNLYVPTYQEWLAENSAQNGGTPILGFEYIGKGTLAQPFTDTIVYTLNAPLTPPVVTPNTAIQNALDGDTIYSYVGAGTRLNPEKSGQTIIVQPNNIGYIFTSDFDYSNLRIKFEEDVICTTTGYLIDMDNSSNFDSENARVTIEILENKSLSVSNTLGFRNSGNTSTTPPSYSSGRVIVFLGDGEIYSDYNDVDVLTRYIFNGEGNNNDDGLHFQVECKVRSIYSGIYYCKNKQRIDFYNQLTSGILDGSVNVSLQAFKMTGGQVRFFGKGEISVSSEISGRNYGFTFEPQDGGIGYCIFQLNSAKVSGSANYMFVKLNNENVSFSAFNSPSGYGFATVIPGTNTVVNGLFENLGVDKWGVSFKNNVFSYTGIDFTKVDLTNGNTISSINTIGNSIIEALVVYNNRANALSAGVPLYSAFLNRGNNGVDEGSELNPFPDTSKWRRDIVLPA